MYKYIGILTIESEEEYTEEELHGILEDNLLEYADTAPFSIFLRKVVVF